MPDPRLEPNQILQGDCREILRTLPSASIDSIVTDPPAGIAFMGKDWDNPDKFDTNFTEHGYSDGQDRIAAPTQRLSNRNPMCRKCRKHMRGAGGCECLEPESDEPPEVIRDLRFRQRDGFVRFMEQVMTECYRVLKPGGHMFVWALPRTSHWTATAIENAGFEIRDCVYHVFGCLSEDTEILTEVGWEPYHTLVEGRLALCYDAEHDGFQWQPIQQVYVYPYKDTAYRLLGDHTDQLVSRNHRCLVERGGRTVFEYAETLQREENVPVLEDVPGLLQALPLPYEGTGHSEPDVLARLLKHEQSSQEGGAQDASCDLPWVRQDVPTQEQCLDAQSQVLRDEVRGYTSGDHSRVSGAPQGHRQARASWVDGSLSGVLPQEDVWGSQSCLEGWSDLLLEARELRLGEVRAVPAGLSLDGSQGRVCGRTSSHCGSGRLQTADAGGDGASFQPRSYGQPRGELGSLPVEQGTQVVRASRFTTSDLVRVEPVPYEGVVWCVRVPSGSFVARRAGKAFVTGNSGFPKSLNVSKAIDKMKGATREVVGTYRVGGNALTPTSEKGGTYGVAVPNSPAGDLPITKPATPEAEQWDGWGTALKPAVECWWLCRKPIEGTNVARNVLQHGTGAINIDGTRIAGTAQVPGSVRAVRRFDDREDEPELAPAPPPNAAGRWPSNLMLSHSEGCRQVGTREVAAPTINRFDDGMKPFGEGAGHPYTQTGGGTEQVSVYECVDGCPVRAMNEQSGETGGGTPRLNSETNRTAISTTAHNPREPNQTDSVASYGDTGGAARYFQTFDKGRWPSNIVLSHTSECVRRGTTEEWDCAKACPIAELDRQGEEMGIHKAGSPQTAQEKWDMSETTPSYGGGFSGPSGMRYGDEGGASRFFQNLEPGVPFFYTAKAARSEKEEGLNPFESTKARQNTHPTVKPISLMRYLVKMVTPPGGIVLDPFTGSGSTLIAAAEEGMKFIGIEREDEYVKIARSRVGVAAERAETRRGERDIFELMMVLGDE